MKRLCAIALFLIESILCYSSSPVVIRGSYSSFRNKELFVTYKKEGLTRKEFTLGKALVSENGSFKIEFPINRTQVCYVRLGAYLGVIFAEPGGDYEIDFNILDTTKLNTPTLGFEDPEKVILGLEAQRIDQLQTQVGLFEKQLKWYQDQVILNQDADYAQKVVDASIDALNKQFGVAMDKNQYLKDYIYCNYAMLELLINNKRGYVVNNYLNKPIINDTNNPAFWDLMSSLWADHLSEMSVQDLALYRYAIENQDVTALKYIFTNQVKAKVLPWVNWALLEILYGEKSGLNYPLESIIESINKSKKWSNDLHFQSCCDLLIKDVRLMSVGSQCPVQQLVTIDGKQLNLTKYRGKILALYFFNSRMPTTRRDLMELKELKQKSRGIFEVVGVLCLEDALEAKSRIDAYKYDINFVKCSEPDEFYQFQIFDIPIIQLYDQQGRVISSKAPTPGDGLKAYVNKFIQSVSKRTPENLFN